MLGSPCFFLGQRGQVLDAVHTRARVDQVSLTRTMRHVIACRLRELGGEVELVAPTDVYHMHDTPDQIEYSVLARFRGTGARRIFLLAHMDTMCLRERLVEQPFRIDGDRAHGLGIANEEVRSPGSRAQHQARS